MQKIKIAVVGDSIAWGSCDEQYYGWVNRLQLRTEGRTVRFLNLSFGGESLKSSKERMFQEMEARRVDRVILALGISDAAWLQNGDGSLEEVQSEASFRKDVQHVLGKLSEKYQDVYVLGLTNIHEENHQKYIPKVRTNERIEAFDAILREESEHYKCSFISVFGILNDEDFYKDGIHPNAEGHKKIAERVASVLTDIL